VPANVPALHLRHRIVWGGDEPQVPEAELLDLSAAVWTSRGSCTIRLPAAVAALEVIPSEELKHFLPVTQLVLTVSGTEWARTEFGAMDAAGRIEPPSFFGRNVDRVHSLCAGPTEQGQDVGVPLGTHRLELHARIAEAPVQPAPVGIDVDLSCAGGGIQFGTGSTVGGPSSPSPSSGRGCQAGNPRSEGLLALACVLVILLRRWLAPRDHRSAPHAPP
jgi:hypothetical protein